MFDNVYCLSLGILILIIVDVLISWCIDVVYKFLMCWLIKECIIFNK